MLSFSSYGWLTVMAILDSSEDKTPIVGYPDAYRFDPYCRTALGVQRDLVKAYQRIASCNVLELTVTPSCSTVQYAFSG